MKKQLIFLILAALLLCACGTVPAAEPSPVLSEPGPVPTEAPAAPAVLSPGAAELSALLGELRQNVTVATAGSSLRAVAMAARLLDWAEGAELTDEEILAALAPWLAELDDGIPADFSEQLGAVDGALALLTGPEAEEVRGILSDAGCEDCGYPWSEHAGDLAERIMALAGLRNPSDEN